MSNVFNTPFEISLRVLLILEASVSNPLTVDMITAADFITVHGKEFGVHDNNLHGDNVYKFSEFTVRREMVKAATKSLGLDSLITVRYLAHGFAYALTASGAEYCKKLSCSYAKEYRANVVKTLLFLKNKTEQDVLNSIVKLSVGSLYKMEKKA